MPALVSDEQWSRLSEFIAERTGLHFPRGRLADLERGVAAAARELGFGDIEACVGWLLSASPTPLQIRTLASHLTVGETYFFRDKKVFELLAADILPELVRSRRGREQRLRLWSAACSTGEEAYSLAIVLHEAVPDLLDWHATITATDINARFLHKAAAGIYGEWSFRDTPAGFRQRYFRRTEDGRHAVLPEFRKRLNFKQLNLAEDVYPSLATDTNAMDVIFCRNALMYFTSRQLRKVVRNLYNALAEGGWLVVSPSEASHALFPQFETVNFPGVILYRKSGKNVPPRRAPRPAAVADAVISPLSAAEIAAFQTPTASETAPALPAAPALDDSPAAEGPVMPHALADSLYRQGRYAEAADMLLGSVSRIAGDPRGFSLLARALANQGELADALAWCDIWISADKLDAAAHYLRAVVLLERGEMEQARSSLQRALYLRPDLVLAHFALGNLDRGRGKLVEAKRSYANALRLLARYEPNDILPESDGLTAGRLIETIGLATGIEIAP